jgi:hypothetical protein
MVARYRRPPELKDIRPELKLRLDYALSQSNYHQETAKTLAAEAEDLTRMLQREDARFNTVEAVAFAVPATPLDDFVLKTLTTQPMTKDQLRECALKAGYNGENLGRSIHAVTINLTRGGKIWDMEGLFRIVTAQDKIGAPAANP